MKAKPYHFNGTAYRPCEPDQATHIRLNLPGPLCERLMPVITKGSRDAHEGPIWTWNKDTERPTLKPSILTKGGRQLTDDEYDKWKSTGELPVGPIEIVCHTWITNGQAIFLNDCTHELAGQTHDLLDVD